MSAYGLVRRALVTLYRSDAIQTVALARQAQAQSPLPWRIRGLAALREAQGLALAGDAAACRDALRRAGRDLARADAIDGADGVLPALGSTLADSTAMVTGWCLYDLGRPAEAAAVLDKEIRRLPEDARRTRTRFTTRQALACAAAGEVDQACALTGHLLPDASEVASATIRHDLYQLARTLRRWPSHPPVREIQPGLDHLLRTQAHATP
jgi:ATP/maltotriose-dependent transcriptional regulator MalT